MDLFNFIFKQFTGSVWSFNLFCFCKIPYYVTILRLFYSMFFPNIYCYLLTYRINNESSYSTCTTVHALPILYMHCDISHTYKGTELVSWHCLHHFDPADISAFVWDILWIVINLELRLSFHKIANGADYLLYPQK